MEVHIPLANVVCTYVGGLIITGILGFAGFVMANDPPPGSARNYAKTVAAAVIWPLALPVFLSWGLGCLAVDTKKFFTGK